MTQTTEMFEKDFTNLSTCDTTKVLVLLKHSRHACTLNYQFIVLFFLISCECPDMFKRPLSTQKPLYLAMQIIFLSSAAMLPMTHANTVEEEEANATSQPKTQLATITLTAQDKTAVTENTGSYTTSSTNTATKLNLSLRETPQTVKVYTREYLDDRNIESFQDLMSNITGV